MPGVMDAYSSKHRENDAFQGFRHLAWGAIAEQLAEDQTQVERGDVASKCFRARVDASAAWRLFRNSVQMTARSIHHAGASAATRVLL